MNLFHNQNPADAMVFSLAQHGAGFKLSSNFALVEMASKDGADEVLVHPALVLLLQHLRDHFDAVVHVNSGYRSPAHNQAIGGAAQSRHLWGMAADVTVFGRSPDEVADYLESLDPGGLGRYRDFSHVDVEGDDRRWDRR